ncbi:cephalosporin-C deacetylase [Diaminobutyricimonas aerilata]|uniref:Cephalosporin-C deacetylase n=1 Tax=Diaminobutyricimonas aerilata TaxID=1162967 RepID=A0A2M9CN96_9MICO|nr:acetylxylan esterase [Diaminobutyricimonas aerilata]PJJ73352.1 cephalosporin-C deacetylase [Diaminobutyricimonas aerilata]
MTAEPHDFDEFWQSTIAEARAVPMAVTLAPVDCGLETVDVFDVTYPGYGGHPIRAWLRVPRGRREPRPAVVHFTGYGAGRGAPIDDLLFASAGYAHLVMDTRGQGDGGTEDPGHGFAPSGYLARGVLDPHEYYYRRVFTDAVRAIDAVRSLDPVDPLRVAAVGNSQGAGIAIAAGVLGTDIRAVLAQAPLLSDFPRALAATDRYPYREIPDLLSRARHLETAVLRTLSYFDTVNLARRATAPAWFSIGELDDITPASTVRAVHDAWAAERHIVTWPHNGHDAGGSEDLAGALRVLRRVFDRP